MRNWTAIAWLAASATCMADSQPTAPHFRFGDPALAGLVEDALGRNPGIHAAEARYQEARQLARQATALPDPTVALTRHVEPIETRLGPQTGGITFSQKLPWFGKRAERGQTAAWMAEALRLEAAAVAAETVRQVRRRYFELGYLDRAIGLANEEAELLRHYEALARARYSQGAGLQQEVVKLQAEITRARSRRHGHERRRFEVESALNALRDRPAHLPLPKVELPATPERDYDYEALVALGLEARPEVQASFARVESARSAKRLSERAHWPDLVVGAAWGSIGDRRDPIGRSNPPPGNGDDAFSVSIGVNLPIHKSALRAGDAAAAARVQSAINRLRETQQEVRRGVRAASAEIDVVEQQIDLFERALLPQAEQALATTEEAYSTGTVGVLALLDSEEVLIDVRLGLARLRADRLRAYADLAHASGEPVPRAPHQEAP